METRFLVKALYSYPLKALNPLKAPNTLKALACLMCATLIALCSVPQSQASERQRISFYKINKDGITQALRFTRRKARKPGCHNFIRKARLHKVVQFQYAQCQVFSQKNCSADSQMQFYRDDEPDILAKNLTSGFGWRPVGDHKRGEKAKSWHCQAIEAD